uniref:Uncharacterized protein n=1 Tax=Anopheles christyi TaxID=43041 RepID=A0A182KIZ5_9DIPT
MRRYAKDPPGPAGALHDTHRSVGAYKLKHPHTLFLFMLLLALTLL